MRSTGTLWALGIIFFSGCVIKSLPPKMGSEKWGVEVTWHGHSCFSLRDDLGRTIVLDPYDETVGYGRLRLNADALLITHTHFDHRYKRGVKGRLNPVEVLEATGTHSVANGMNVIGVASDHDVEGGQIHGPNRIYSFMMGGLRMVHLGDLGTPHLTPMQVAKIGRPDVLFIPVGGFTTLDAVGAKKVIESLKPRAVVPMHYGDVRFYKLAPVSEFTELYSEKTVINIEKTRYRFVKSDFSDQTQIFVFNKPESGK